MDNARLNGHSNSKRPAQADAWPPKVSKEVSLRLTLTSRRTICSALSNEPWEPALQIIAQRALLRAGCEAGADPRRIAVVGLGYRIRCDPPGAPYRAEVRGGLIVFIWTAADRALNLAAGCAIALAWPTSTAGIYQLAGHLAQSMKSSAGSHLPAWFVDAYKRNRPAEMMAVPGRRLLLGAKPQAESRAQLQ
jgi:hypothetical protein